MNTYYIIQFIIGACFSIPIIVYLLGILGKKIIQTLSRVFELIDFVADLGDYYVIFLVPLIVVSGIFLANATAGFLYVSIHYLIHTL